MHIECCSGLRGCDERKPSSLMTIISPGSTSRTYFASIRSKAQVSDATTQASSRRPSANGRKPRLSRIAINSFGVRKKIGRASCRERVYISDFDVLLHKIQDIYNITSTDWLNQS